MSLRITSPAFAPSSPIPSKFTCEGEDFSPPLAWSGVPDGAASLALIVDDPDAPDPQAPKRTWVHWVVVNLPADTDRLGQNATHGGLPAGAVEGRNDWDRQGWNGPCPPTGRHRYFFKLYALDTSLADLGSPTKADVERAMSGHIVAQAELIGTYEKGEGA